MFGRLLKGLQQRVERLGREHVDFIDDVNLVATLGGAVTDRVPQFPDIVDAAVGCPVYFQDINGVSLCDFATVGALVARNGGGPRARS